MKKVILIVLLVGLPAYAQTDARTDELSVDLKTLGRIATLAKNLRDTRQVMDAIVDENVEQYREPRGDGTYRWASLSREEAGRETVEKTVDRVRSESKLTTINASASKGYRVSVAVPRKKGVFADNNPVFVQNILAEWTTFDGRRHQQDIPVNVWVKPGDAHGVALPEIGKSVKVAVNTGIESSDKKAVAEVSVLQAKLVDDPANPNYPIVRRLLGISALLDKDPIKRTDLKTAIDDALLALPGELQKRFNEDTQTAAQRLALAQRGEMRGSVSFGDATPDVVARLEEIHKLLSGTYDDQSRAREKILALIELLRAPSALP